jgi:hypothetical protein
MSNSGNLEMNTYFKILINSQVIHWRKTQTKLDVNVVFEE